MRVGGWPPSARANAKPSQAHLGHDEASLPLKVCDTSAVTSTAAGTLLRNDELTTEMT